jgi:ParB-like chromosome segregation protein Spo0J
MDAARLNVDLHLLELRFAGARLIELHAVERLARSIERDGQIVPCIVVGPRWTLRTPRTVSGWF